MIKAIIFDAGGVIVEHANQLDEFAKVFKSKDKERLWETINHSLGPLCEGEISEEEFWKEIAEIENTNPNSIPENLWLRKYEESTNIDREIINLIKKLRSNYKTIMISNTIKPHVIINKKRGLFDDFDDVILSNEVHLSKDSREIFELALKRNKLEPNECIFIDDIQKFVDIANSMGMKGILYKDSNQLKNDLENLDIKY